mmetsp:Transcript_120667/g.385246  ORF Transcript_120667/g.385246 Transcript_120667/m.385246 type:complete len:241 (+) Transcript_120667:1647-2369(+)
MFHPMGPNLRRSCTTAWKKQNPKSKGLKTSGFKDCLKTSSVITEYDRNKFARRPEGGSFVILTPFCRTCTGKVFAGMEVNHNLKLFDMFSGLSCSTRASKLDIQDSMRWQLDSSTQPPVPWAFSIIFVAFGPWPWPREIDSKRFSRPSFSANLMTSATGSVPGERMKISGVVFTESAKDFAMSKVGGSTNFCPIWSEMKVMTAAPKQSMRIARMKQSFSKDDSLPSQSPGIGSLSACTES